MNGVRPLFLLLVLSVATLSAQHTITLEQVRQAALANSPNTTDKQLFLEAGELRAKTVNNAWLPQVKGVAQGTYQSEVTEIDLSAMGFPAITISPDQYHAGFEVQQTIYEFGATKAKHDLELTTAQAQAARSDVDLLSVTQRMDKLYATLLLQRSGLEILRSRAKDLHAQLEQVSSAVRNGVSLKSNEEVLKAESLTTQQQIVTSETGLAQTVSELSIWTGLTLDTTMTFVLPQAPAPAGMGQRPELRAFELQRSGLDVQAKLLKKGNLPHLAAFGNGYYGRPGFNFLNNDFRTYGIVGVGLNWNLAGYYTQGKQLQENTVQQKLIDDRKRIFELQQATDLEREAKEITKLDRLAELDSSIVESKTFVRKAAASQLENGVITAQDYVTYQNAQDQAKLNLELHRIQAVMARIAYQLTQGN
ncbi:MAG: TolC family protein [Flavobacteriales bacterium]|nr:TolC family protein [Flavobacteriales bacterium]